MAVWLKSMVIPVGLTAAELFLLRYLVYGKKRYKRSGTLPSQVVLAVFFCVGVFLQVSRFWGSSGMGSYLKILVKAAYYYLILTGYLNINRRLAFYYLVIFYIPVDVCDLAVFVTMLRNWGIDVSGSGLMPGQAFIYLWISFLLRLLVLSVIRRFMDENHQRSLSGMQMILIAIAVLPFLYMRDLGFWLPLSNDEIGSWSLIFLGVTGVISLLLVIGNERMVYYHIQRNELLKMQHLIHHQHEQYELRREAVDLVNQKYHDMRHQLMGILGMDDVKEIHRYVDSLRCEITPFESFFRTGNQLMDIILSEKARECAGKNIQLVPTVDGSVLSVLEAADLCTIFGNALDNAIESCEKLPEGRSRRITLKVYAVRGFLGICLENSCIRRMRREEGHFLTTKDDAENHGFGLKGIRQAVEKYQGVMETEIQGSEFVLTLLIPLTEDSAPSS